MVELEKIGKNSADANLGEFSYCKVNILEVSELTEQHTKCRTKFYPLKFIQ